MWHGCAQRVAQCALNGVHRLLPIQHDEALARLQHFYFVEHLLLIELKRLLRDGAQAQIETQFVCVASIDGCARSASRGDVWRRAQIKDGVGPWRKAVQQPQSVAVRALRRSHAAS